MTQTLVARIPESGLFGGIAQDLDFAESKLRAALEQPAVEPVAYGRWHEDGYIDMVFLDRDECKQYLEYEEEPVCLFTTPPPPANVPLLTDDEIYEMYTEPRSDAEMLAFGREVEQAVRKKAGLK